MMQMKAKQIVLSRGLPKTSQTTERLAGDDGTYQAGWWKGLKIAGNKTRFIEQTISGAVILIDRATGLTWTQDASSTGGNGNLALNWDSAIGVANALDFAGFTDWRIPNILEFTSILNFTKVNDCLYAEFANIRSGVLYWSSTCYSSVPVMKYCINSNIPLYDAQIKTDSNYMLCVRGGV